MVVRCYDTTYNEYYKVVMLKRILHQGFALPSIMIASVVMLAVLATAVSSVTTTRTAIDEQYYQQLAREAAESGVIKAEACIVDSGYVVPWKDEGNTLRDDSDCEGLFISGMTKFIETGTLRVSFEVIDAEMDASLYRITSVGKVEQLRASNQSVWKTHTYTRKANIEHTNSYGTKIVSGYRQVCGIIDDQAACWGENIHGKLGDGTTTARSTPTYVLQEPGVLENKTVTDISVGQNFACAVAETNVYCWGANEYGQLGRGYASTAELIPALVTGGLESQEVISIHASSFSACALTNEGRLYCWGNNGSGQLGTGNTISRLVPTQVTYANGFDPGTIEQVATKSNSPMVCAISSARLYCWGRNLGGSIGDGTTTNKSVPTRITGIMGNNPISHVDVGYSGSKGHSCAVSLGRLYCWGGNGDGMLGDGTTTTRLQPVEVLTGEGLTPGTVSRVAVSDTSACALTNDDKLFCWGSNAYGQLGINSITPAYSTTPKMVYRGTTGDDIGNRTISSLVGGGWRACAIADNKLFCWGSNNYYQVGDGTDTDRYRPTLVRYMKQRKTPIWY